MGLNLIGLSECTCALNCTPCVARNYVIDFNQALLYKAHNGPSESQEPKGKVMKQITFSALLVLFVLFTPPNDRSYANQVVQ